MGRTGTSSVDFGIERAVATAVSLERPLEGLALEAVCTLCEAVGHRTGNVAPLAVLGRWDQVGFAGAHGSVDAALGRLEIANFVRKHRRGVGLVAVAGTTVSTAGTLEANRLDCICEIRNREITSSSQFRLE